MKRLKKIFLYTCFIGLICAIVGVAALAALIQWASKELPSFQSVADYRPLLVTEVYAADQKTLLGYLYHEKRFAISLDDMTPMLPAAFIATEDASFYTHSGINPMAILRAFIRNLQAGEVTQGGSTITQQVVKALLLSPDRKYIRKLKEAILAYRLERYLSKQDILTIYLNLIFLGDRAYGVEAAARTYFGKHAKDLTLAECAVIGGLAQSPSKRNPYSDPAGTRIRQIHVLGRLLEHGSITQEQYDAALVEPLNYQRMDEGIFADGACYMEEVRRQLVYEIFTEENAKALGLNINRYGEDAVYELGLRVYTAMDPELQTAAVRSLRGGLEALDRRQGWLGPVEKVPLEASATAAWLAKHPFAPDQLIDGKWALALVDSVERQKAEVKLGGYSGTIDLKQMSWARQPNPKIDGMYAAAVQDAAKVLAPGDVIWVAALPSTDKYTYDPAKVTVDAPIPLMLRQVPKVQGAIVSMKLDTGDVLAMSGGYNYAHSQFNRATQARRQPGSSFKPIVYSAALDNGYTAGSVVLDAPFVSMGEHYSQIWRPQNYEGVFHGPTLLATALAKSRNLCTIRVAQEIGMPAVVERAHRLGIDGDIPAELSVSLGAYAVSPMTMVEAYSPFANSGRLTRHRFVTRITDNWGNVLLAPPPDVQEAISPQNAYIMLSMLKGVVQRGTAARANSLGRPLAGKTGTTNDENDAWFVGFTPQIVTSVYVGYDQIAPLGRAEGGARSALPIFIDYQKVANTRFPPDDFPIPPGIVFAKVDEATGRLAGLTSKASVLLPFIEGTQPSAGGVRATGEDGSDLLRNLD